MNQLVLVHKTRSSPQWWWGRSTTPQDVLNLWSPIYDRSVCGTWWSGWAHSVSHPCIPISSVLRHMVYLLPFSSYIAGSKRRFRPPVRLAPFWPTARADSSSIDVMPNGHIWEMIITAEWPAYWPLKWLWRRLWRNTKNIRPLSLFHLLDTSYKREADIRPNRQKADST